ncbi:MAG: hypothetical protein REI93_14860, partial [Pedobacter sp.]|nr:hypothetical protein [Pedobacter sp.]
FVYTATSKLIDFAGFERQLQQQHFNTSIVSLLKWSIPFLEICTATLLTFGRTRRVGLILSALLMATFTSYVGLALAGVFSKMPCSCGGVLKNMGWKLHFWFNLLFLSLSIIGLTINQHIKKE